ncbi:PilN domain-containing protein [Uliginosibacterium sp. 31-16]|uniref:PilN domain-containing protein n=1 Tax=Uliginosibacterium sp. 31-16 TaxID=3068315 RepID=UPI00273E4755|nr:PilN domain-containing protein [Uliginosibacterium sp. 31-16]MDP5240241.1 PilN domain-containing protein [Uliginosibacterium sp. 31-16]
MKRQINLVNPALLPPKPFFQFRSMMLALGVLAAGLLLLGTFMLSRLGAYEAAAAQAQERLLAKQEQMKQQEKVLVRRQPDPQVATRLEGLRTEQEDLQRIDQALQADGLPGQGTDKAANASAYLYELARQPLPNVWLTDIQLRGKDISLQGMASNAAAIPATLSLLNRLPAFQGQNFAAFEAGRKSLTTADPAKPVEVLSFRLESAAARETVR